MSFKAYGKVVDYNMKVKTIKIITIFMQTIAEMRTLMAIVL